MTWVPWEAQVGTSQTLKLEWTSNPLEQEVLFLMYPGSANLLYMNNPAFWPPANMPGAAGGPIPLAMAPPPPLQPPVQPPMTGSQIRSEAGM